MQLGSTHFSEVKENKFALEELCGGAAAARFIRICCIDVSCESSAEARLAASRWSRGWQICIFQSGEVPHSKSMDFSDQENSPGVLRWGALRAKRDVALGALPKSAPCLGEMPEAGGEFFGAKSMNFSDQENSQQTGEGFSYGWKNNIFHGRRRRRRRRR